MDKQKVVVSQNGPYLVSGSVPLSEEIIKGDAIGRPVAWKQGKNYPHQEVYALCRCGHSTNKPYCDGSHLKAGFDGTETAGNHTFLEISEKTSGPTLDLLDAEVLCSGAGFCQRGGGTWKLTEKSDDPESRKLAIQEAADCPSGRLVAVDKATGKTIEPAFKPSISVTGDEKDPDKGPIWVKGGISVVSADNVEYERRNRVTLCRCGKSENKPFCHASHFDD